MTDLANADKYIILRLRGFDYPQVAPENRFTVYDICDKRALAIALVAKCTAPPAADQFAFQQFLPRNMVPVYGGTPPGGPFPAWYGTNYSIFNPPPTDEVVMVDQWDGCTFLPAFSMTGHLSPNGKLFNLQLNVLRFCSICMYIIVIGLGNVDQVASIKDPHLVLQELTCKYTPGPRAWHGALAYEERLYVMGGKNGSTDFYADTWYREAVFPVARMLEAPLANTGKVVLCDRINSVIVFLL